VQRKARRGRNGRCCWDDQKVFNKVFRLQWRTVRSPPREVASLKTTCRFAGQGETIGLWRIWLRNLRWGAAICAFWRPDSGIHEACPAPDLCSSNGESHLAPRTPRVQMIFQDLRQSTTRVQGVRYGHCSRRRLPMGVQAHALAQPTTCSNWWAWPNTANRFRSEFFAVGNASGSGICPSTGYGGTDCFAMKLSFRRLDVSIQAQILELLEEPEANSRFRFCFITAVICGGCPKSALTL